jgi:formate dehydrogenase iron-sulfur subunit
VNAVPANGTPHESVADTRRPDGRLTDQIAVRVFVPRDASARAVGADAVAAALVAEAARRGRAIELVRTGSRGMAWLEPLVEVATPAGRLGYGAVSAGEVPALLDAGLLDGGPLQGTLQSRSLGLVDELPWLARQRRLATARIGRVDPRSFGDFVAHGGGQGLQQALALAPAAIVQAVLDSGLRGRGGAAFPAGIKWRTVLGAAGPRKHVVCNADEGDSGSFADRLLMEGDPFGLLEGMAIAALAVGATEGWIYVRSEYPDAIVALREAIASATAAGWLGERLAGQGPPFHVHLRVGAGSYVCGEETALLESLEGRRGIVRAKPPLPAHQGLFGEPTLVNNVITLASVPAILSGGAAAYAALGQGRSRGTMPFQLAGNLRHGGLVELPFGCTLRELVFDWGGGTASGRPVKAVQVGGPLGRYVPEAHWDLPIDYEAWAAVGAVVGHGSLVVHDDSADMALLARHAMAFCVHESCGKCTPCRIGAQRGVETIDRLLAAPDSASRQRLQGLLVDLCGTMQHGSLCAMGGMTPYPVLSALEQHPADFGLPSAAASAAAASVASAPSATSATPPAERSA